MTVLQGESISDGVVMECRLVPLGEPEKLLHSEKWQQNIGVVLPGDKEDVQATVYGSTYVHARERAEKFIRLLVAGKVIIEEKEDEDAGT